MPKIAVMDSTSENSTSFDPVRPRQTGDQSPVTEECVKTFMRHSSLVKQLDFGKHQLALEHETLFDKALKEYATKLDRGASKVPTVGGISKSSLTGNLSYSHDGKRLEIDTVTPREIYRQAKAVP